MTRESACCACLSGRSTLCICCWALALVAAWSSFTTWRDALDKMACSSALIPSLSSNDTDARCALANVKTTSMLGGEEALLQSPLNNWHDLSHARCNGVLPSRSCMAHASGHALASNCTIDKHARVLLLHVRASGYNNRRDVVIQDWVRSVSLQWMVEDRILRMRVSFM